MNRAPKISSALSVRDTARRDHHRCWRASTGRHSSGQGSGCTPTSAPQINSVSVVDLVKAGDGGARSGGRKTFRPCANILPAQNCGSQFNWRLCVGLWIRAPRKSPRRIPVGALPYSLDFSPDGSRAYVAGIGEPIFFPRLIVVTRRVGRHHPDRFRSRLRCASRRTGSWCLSLNKKDATIGIYDAVTLKLRATAR